MPDRTILTGRAVPVLAALIVTAACAACTLLQPAPRQPAAATRPASSRAPAPAGTAAARPGLAALLLASPAWIEAAAALAARFAAACTTWSYDQPPADWLARLRPMTASQLYGALARPPGHPGSSPSVTTAARRRPGP